MGLFKLTSFKVIGADDEETICSVGTQMLERLGFDVMTAPDGLRAVELYNKHKDDIVCVLLDLTMPHMDGEEAFRELRQINPEVKTILCSGYNMQEVRLMKEFGLEQESFFQY